MGLTVTRNNIYKIVKCNAHSYGTVILPIRVGNEIVKKRYIIDCTYRQFFTVARSVVSLYLENQRPDPGFFVKLSGPEETAFAKRLLQDGFIEATSENLKHYHMPFFLGGLNLEDIDRADEFFSQLNILNIIDTGQEKEYNDSEDELEEDGIILTVPSAQSPNVNRKR